MWNEITYGLMQLYFQGRLDREAAEEVWRRHYRKYRDILEVNAGQRRTWSENRRESWRSLSGLLRAKKEGRLLLFIKRVSPPSYWKDRVLGKRIERIVIRDDWYI